MNTSNRLLRNLIREVLLSEDDYGGLIDAGIGMSPYGAHFASGDQMYNTFVKPFVDVGNVAAGKTKEASKQISTSLKVAFESVATTLLPFLRDSYSEIFKEEKEALDKIKNEYNDVYNATWDAFKDNDVVCMAFAYNPGSVITQGLAKTAPEAVSKLLSVLSGGSLDGFLDQVKKKFGSAPSKGHDNAGAGNSDSWMDESVLREDDQDDARNLSASDVLADKKVINKALASPEARRMQSEAQNAVRKSLTTVYKQAQAITSATSLEDLQTKLGKKIPGLEKLNNIPEDQRQQSEQDILTKTKKSMTEFLVKSLQAQVQTAIKGGIPKTAQYVKDYQSVISKVQTL